MKPLKHTLASTKDRKPTIVKGEMERFLGNDFLFRTDDSIKIYYPEYRSVIEFKSSRNGATWYGQQELPADAPRPKVGSPVEINAKPYYQILTNQFYPIRNWAIQRELYKKGNPQTQMLKLTEEFGELAKAMIDKDKTEMQDAIGDMVVVLTNLSELLGFSIEDCINIAYNDIKDRTGKMVNNSFKKDE